VVLNYSALLFNQNFLVCNHSTIELSYCQFIDLTLYNMMYDITMNIIVFRVFSIVLEVVFTNIPMKVKIYYCYY